MAQVRAVRRPYSSSPGRVNDAARTQAPRAVKPQEQPKSNLDAKLEESNLATVELPGGDVPAELPEASNEEREAPGTGEEMIEVEVTPEVQPEAVIEYSESTSDTAVVSEPTPEPLPTPVDYSAWTVVQLSAELKNRDLSSSGSKAELVARLLESDVDAG